MINKFYHHLWGVIHLAALNYKKDDTKKEDIINFYKSLAPILGCRTCQEHYIGFMIDNPPNFEDLFGWSVDLHNSVNESRGDRVFTRIETMEYWTRGC